MARRGTEETRPGEPGYSGRPSSGVLADMNRAYGGMAKVKRAQFVGYNTKGQKVYKMTIQTSMGVHHSTEAWDGSRFHKAGKLRGTKSNPDIYQRDPGQREREKNEAALRVAKDRWFVHIDEIPGISPFQREQLVRTVQRWQGSPQALDQKMAETIKRTWGPMQGTDPDDDESGDGFDIDGWLDSIGGGGGGGGGFSGPQYVAPDRRVVEDQVKGALISLVGNIPNDAMVDQFTDLYMSDHRRDFDTEDKTIDPAQSVREAIRETDHYKAIHELRPDSEDERGWVSQRRAAAQEGGLDTGQQEDFAITQATVGGDLGDVKDAAAVRQTKRSGTTRGTSMEQRMRDTARKMMTGVMG